MSEQKWFYYVHNDGNVVARVNSDAFEWRMGEMGFQSVSYSNYLKARKLIREQEVAENKINMALKIRGENNGNN